MPQFTQRQLAQVVARLQKADRPVLVAGSQVVQITPDAAANQQAILNLNIPTYLSGMARGLLGHEPLHLRHKRKEALREADLVILAGVPCDFRLGYGSHINRRAALITINRNLEQLGKNRKPDIGVLAEPGAFLRAVAAALPTSRRNNQPSEGLSKGVESGGQPSDGLAPTQTTTSNRWATWHETLHQRDALRDEEIRQQAAQATAHINPLHLCLTLEQMIGPDAVLIGDGGDFVATMAYTVRPRTPLSWLDPGPFGTLGVGAGFALGARLCRPEAEIWLFYGDGACAYSLAEFDTFARHKLPIIAVVGNDAAWSQIARDQVVWFGTAVGTQLVHTDYHAAAQGFGGVGYKIDGPDDLPAAIHQAKQDAAQGHAVLLNVLLGTTDFRKGAISI